MNQSAENWSLRIGRWRGVDVRLHIQFPLLMLGVLWATVQTDLATPRVAVLALLVLLVSVGVHELSRLVAAARVGGYTTSMVLAPTGGRTKLHLPVNPPAHLATSLAGPMAYLVLMVAGACGLALAGDLHVPRLLHPCHPRIDTAAASFQLLGQLVVWTNWCLLLVSLLPIDPCDGAELMRSVLWPIVGRTTATVATSYAALAASVFAGLLAFVLRHDASAGFAPSWFPLATAAVFLFYGGVRRSRGKRYDVGLAIDEFDSDDEPWLSGEWEDEDREAVLVEHLQDKQQEALDRKRREHEASEDARVDAILARLRHTSFEQLSEEERAVLKRASRRYRRRLISHNGDE